ncbi:MULTISPECIES: hypothetical protein [unclassified Myroides]|uniref:hypothetical protein n=1 Tax=unclassified Myroides TaxID=2642485 RepID=UPI003D2F72BF
MKKLLLIILFLSLKGYSQKLVRDEVTGMYKMDTIVNTTLNQEALYSNAIKWIVSKNRDANTEILSKNEDLGEILFKASSQSYVVGERKRGRKTEKTYDLVTFYFNGKVIVKEGKYRLIFSDLEKQFLVDVRIPLVPTMITEEMPDAVIVFKYLTMYQNSFIRSMNQKSDNDF